MLSVMKKFVNDLPLRNKIIATILLINIIIVSVILGVDASFVRTQNNKLLYQTQAAALSGASLELEANIERYEVTAASLVTDGIIQKNLIALANDPTNLFIRATAFDDVNAQIQSYETQFSSLITAFISIYTDTVSYSTNVIQEKKANVSDTVLTDLKQQAIAEDGRCVWMIDGQYLLMAQAIRQYEPFTLNHVGILVVGFHLDKLIAQCTRFSRNFDGAYFVLLNDQKEFLYLPENLSQDLQQQIAEIDTEYLVLDSERHSYFAIAGFLSEQNWHYVSLISYDSVHHAVQTSFLLYVLVVLFALLLAVLLCDYFMRKITVHIDFLLQKMETFGGVDSKRLASNYPYQTRKDELGELHCHFDRMADEIEHYIEVDYTNKLLVKDAQLKALEAQIDPHFLYNVLASVNWRAKAIGETEISQMVEALSHVLRATLDNSCDYFTLQKELLLVHNYMIIQKIRFAEQLQFECTIPDEFSNVLIPKLTIQPMIENAIKYAMEQSVDACQITLTAIHQQGALWIQISNTGSQFPEDFNQKLAENEVEANGLGIALGNIQQRLKLNYGENYGLSFENIDQKAVVTLKIPYTKDQ